MAHSYINCSFCGKQEDLETYRLIKHPLVSIMWDERLCFDCAYWKNWIKNPEPNTIIVSGGLYYLDQPLEKPSRTRLHNLKKCEYLFMPATKDVCVCTGMTLRGRIPEALRNHLPNQYVFITRKEYYSIINYCAPACLSKGCFDRYQCYWYDAESAEPNEPWNTVPADYVVGSEECPSFINKTKLYDIR